VLERQVGKMTDTSNEPSASERMQSSPSLSNVSVLMSLASSAEQAQTGQDTNHTVSKFRIAMRTSVGCLRSRRHAACPDSLCRIRAPMHGSADRAESRQDSGSLPQISAPSR